MAEAFSSDPVCIARALDPATPARWLGAAARTALPLAFAVAANPAVTPAILARIALHWPAAHRMVARQRAPARVLGLLARSHPEDVLANPHLEAIVREPRGIPAKLAASMLSRPDAPGWLIAALIEHPLPSLRAVVARFADTPAAQLAELARDPDVAVRVAVAVHPALPREDLARLAIDAIPVRRSVARRITGRVTVELIGPPTRWEDQDLRRDQASGDDLGELAVLAGDPSAWVRGAVAANAAAPEAALLQLAGDSDLWVRRAVAQNPASTTAILTRALLDEPDPWWSQSYRGEALRAVIENPNATSELLERFGAIAGAMTRQQIAMNASTPPALLAKLARDPVAMVRWCVAYRNVVPALADPLSRDADTGVRARIAEVVRDAAILDRLARDPEHRVREGVARNPACPTAVLAKLADDLDAGVRCRVAMHAETPSGALAMLSRDSDELTRRWAFGHERMPFALLLDATVATRELAYALASRLARPDAEPAWFAAALDSGRTWIWEVVAGCVRLPPAVADRVERATEPGVRRVRAKATPEPEWLADDPDPSVRAVVASRGAAAALLCRDPAAVVRIAIATATIEAALLHALAGDPDPGVRAAVAANAATPRATLEQLVRDSDDAVLVALLPAHVELAAELLRLRT
ncbi:MAG: hypothetical protein ABI867_26550 [Kofleriaceae bacterium]